MATFIQKTKFSQPSILITPNETENKIEKTPERDNSELTIREKVAAKRAEVVGNNLDTKAQVSTQAPTLKSGMKLALVYNVFDGIELLPYAVSQIRDYVDTIIVHYQYTNWYGEKLPYDIEPILNNLKRNEVINKAIAFDGFKHAKNWFEAKIIEVNKRSAIRAYLKNEGYTHYLECDVDEFYVPSEFEKAKNLIIENDYDTTSCDIITYILSPTLVTDINTPIKVPFICKLTDLPAGFSANVDPTRVIAGVGTKHFNFPKKALYMHHMETIRRDLLLKYSSTSRGTLDRGRIGELIGIVKGAKDGSTVSLNNIMKPNNFNVTKVQNIFKIPEFTLIPYESSHNLFSAADREIHLSTAISYDFPKHFIYMITTYNRINLLKTTINSWENTRNKYYKWTLIIADDGSDDGTLEYIETLKFSNVDIILIKNNRRGVHYQTNKLIQAASELTFDFGFKSDDDVLFLRHGWDNAYLKAANDTKYHHLIFYDKAWAGEKYIAGEPIYKDGILENNTKPNSIQGAFWTFNKDVLANVGFFDTAKFNVFGYGHIDYSLRCCRLGYNDINNPFDIIGSNTYLKLIQQDYISTNNYNTTWNSENAVAGKLATLKTERKYIPYNELGVDIYSQPVKANSVATINLKNQPITFCVPAYQSYDFVEECLDSIEKQTCPKEILIGVDGCAKTLQKIKDIAYKYRNLKIFWFPKNVGTSIIKNTLASYASNDIISFFDSDDIMNADYSDHVLNNITKSNIVRFHFSEFYHNTDSYTDRRYCANGIMSIYKFNFFALNGFWEHRITEDFDFIERWKIVGENKELPIIGFKRRLHTNNISYDKVVGCGTKYGKGLEKLCASRVVNNIIKNDALITNSFIEIKMNINTYFDKIYCLNLDRRLDKWQTVSQKFTKLGIDVVRFPAVDGNNIPLDILNKYYKINRYEVGCMLSHYKIIQEAKDNHYKRILILEDDVMFDENFLSLFDKITVKLGTWKLLYLGATQSIWNETEYIDRFYYSKHTDGTFAYAVDESVYDEILATETIKNRPIDDKLHDIQLKYYKQCYTYFPNLIIPDVSSSDIRQPRETDGHRVRMKWNLSKYI